VEIRHRAPMPKTVEGPKIGANLSLLDGFWMWGDRAWHAGSRRGTQTVHRTWTRFPRRLTAWACGGSALMLRAQQREGVLDALLEDLVGELSVGQSAGELERPDHHREDAERLHACRLRIVRRQAGGDVVDDDQHAVGVRPLDRVRAATDLVEQGGGRAAVVGAVAVLNRKVSTHVLLQSGAVRRLRADARALFAELVGDRGGDEVLLGCEVGVEREALRYRR
jgi:hypothetical protein